MASTTDAYTLQIPKLRILIVEDDPVMRLGLEHLLRDYSNLEIVGQAEDGYSAIEAALQLQPDLVIVDIGLPELDGIAATQQIKARVPSTRVMILTSHKSDREIVAALSSGADGYCVKGIGLEKLVMAIVCIQDGAVYLDPQVAHCVIQNLQPTVQSQETNPLTERELEVLKLIVEGFSNPEIATVLYVSLSTVKAHIRSIMNKLVVNDRVQAAVVALRSGWI
ncbi:MAG: response regulator transcription factor [Oscillatoriales cyanobacterium RM1_1_9]|nr:response regulator transcription factor [Oscillatoriales cyanobacterium SM2_3_0]NJO45397.1 response regulator transcription factor [Oscillatoriales cyanobacterium RM2_1_1]NJO71585.1 response regulator transcription factor [Oscillatoriales cyanobacterium RM1_1_9]